MATVAAVAAAAGAVAMASNRAFPLRILVNSDVVGAIIGRSGSTIRSVTQQTKARIDVHREKSQDQKEKVITISGSPDSCSEACYQILKICHDEYNRPHEYAGDDVPDPRDDFLPNPDIDTLNILAPANFIGRLIGKGGASIKKIMEQTSTKIKISVNSLTESTGEHTITVVGNLEQIRQAEKLISSKLRSAYVSDMNVSLQALNQQPYLFNNVPLPYVTPGPYAPHQEPLLASMVNPQTSHGPNSIPRSVSMNHTHHQGQMPPPIYPSAPGYLPLYSSMTAPHSAASGLVGFNSIVPRSEQEREIVYIYIPSTMVGVIIGRAGAAIKEMISTSGATIKVAATPPLPKELTKSTDQAEMLSEENDMQNEHNITHSGCSNSENLNAEKDNVLEKLENVYKPPASRNSNDIRPNRNANSSDNSSLRKVTVIGYPASQYSAQYLIYRKVSIESGKSDIKLTVEILVPSQLVGRIIGKGGSSVKNLQKQTRTVIRLPDEKPSQNQTILSTNNLEQPSSSNVSSETIVQITGEFEGSQAAQRHIRGMIRESQYTSQLRSKQSTRNDSQKSNAQSNNIDSCNPTNRHQQSDTALSETSKDIINDKSSNDKGASKEEREQTDMRILDNLTDEKSKKESLPLKHCCDHDESISKATHKFEGKSHSVGTHLSVHGEGTDVVSNNNTINNNNLSKNELSTDVAILKTHDHKVTMNTDEQNSHKENGDTTHHHQQEQQQIINDSGIH